MYRITVDDNCWCSCDKKTAQFLNNELSYVDSYWKSVNMHGRQRKQKVEYTKYMIDSIQKDLHIFHSGLLRRAINYLNKYTKKNWEVVYKNRDIPCDDPYLEGITFRPDQIEMINDGINEGRGILKAPTGTGKSILMLGIISAFGKERVLFLAHNTDIVKQMKGHLKKHFKEHIGEISGNSKTMSRLTVATVQSFVKVAKNYSKSIDVVLVDEAHHCNSLTGNYAKTLMYLDAPVKIGVTATMPQTQKHLMCQEALLGPIISELTMEEAQKLGLLAVPKIEIIKAPPGDMGFMPGMTLSGKKLKSPYAKAYNAEIVENTPRNMLITKLAMERVDAGESVLILITSIDHGELIQKLFQELYGRYVEFVSGRDQTELRNKVIQGLENKSSPIAISSSIFFEGIDIKSLDVIVNAAGGKSEIATLQKIGRALRKTDGKTHATIIDFKDTGHKYMKNHFKTRHTLYVENGWITKNKKKGKKYGKSS